MTDLKFNLAVLIKIDIGGLCIFYFQWSRSQEHRWLGNDFQIHYQFFSLPVVRASRGTLILPGLLWVDALLKKRNWIEFVDVSPVVQIVAEVNRGGGLSIC